MTTTFAQEIELLKTNRYIELFKIDTVVIGGGDIFYITPNVYTTTKVYFGGNPYDPFPVQAQGFERNGSTTAPAQPTLTVSNLSRFFMASILNLGDMVGAKVTRYRTFMNFLDGQADADTSATYSPDVYIIMQKSMHTKSTIQWTLCSQLDRPDVRLPRRQILRDQTTNGLFAPGCGISRV